MNPGMPRQGPWFRGVGLQRAALALLLVPAVAFTAPALAASKVTVPQKKSPRITLEPTGYEKVLVLKSENREYKYFRFSPKTPLVIETMGPTTLTVMVRLLFDLTMKGTQELSLRVEEVVRPGSSKEISSLLLKLQKSTVASLSEERSLVPSKGEDFELTVPSGKHTYRLVLPESLRNGAIARVKMPKTDLQPGSTNGAEHPGDSR